MTPSTTATLVRPRSHAPRPAKPAARSLPPRSRARHVAGVATGVAVHAFFAVTVYYLYFYLRGTPPQPGHCALAVDALLALQFGVVHSLLLWTPMRRRLERLIAPAFYGLFFCAATCLTLLVTIQQWQVGSWALWELSGWPRTAMHGMFIGAWIGLFYTLSLNGFGYQTGFVPWWSWVRRREPPRRIFAPRGAYRILRHPVYLSFLGLIWFTPDMTVDRAVLTGIWTLYVFVGSWLKDLRLVYFLGHTYRQYQAEVPGYPGMPLGPLARVPHTAPS